MTALHHHVLGSLPEAWPHFANEELRLTEFKQVAQAPSWEELSTCLTLHPHIPRHQTQSPKPTGDLCTAYVFQ